MIDSILNTLQSAAGNILQLLTYDPKAHVVFEWPVLGVVFNISPHICLFEGKQVEDGYLRGVFFAIFLL